MVARDNTADDRARRRLTHVMSDLFDSWRRLLGMGIRGTRTGADSAVGLAEDVAGHVGRTLSARSGADALPRPATLVATGLAGLAIGSTGTVLLGRDDIRAAVASAALMTMWCVARLPLMLIASDAHAPNERAAVTRGWGVGLLPYAISVLPALQPVAWTLSLALGFKALDAAGFTRRRAAWCLAWGYGAQVLAVIAAWIVRNAFLAGAVLSS